GDDGGCGCRVPGSQREPSLHAGLLLSALAFGALRRRRPAK
ncbi:MAG: MYXO-CTERM sorting domain-containing protein, partial [Sorangiineae bacterium PRO1]|nr:MYXO-CTERM sorting domain-containing protein [Sorangiineae bacterium PRO1]